MLDIGYGKVTTPRAQQERRAAQTVKVIVEVGRLEEENPSTVNPPRP